MKRSLPSLSLVAVALVGAALLAGCSSSAEPADSAPASSASSASAPATSGASAPVVPAGSGTSLEAYQQIRAAIGTFEEDAADAGGMAFTLQDASGKNKTSFEVSADGSGARDSQYDTGAKERYFWDSKTHWTEVLYINEEMRKLVEQIDPKAEFYSEPKGTFWSLASPDRVVGAFLAYATGASCGNAGGTTQCTVTATGVSTLPGLGSFQTPQDNVTMTVDLDADGRITKVVLFPGNADLERQMVDIKFSPVSVTLPSDAETVTMDEVTVQAIKNDDAAKASASASAAPDGTPAP